MLKPAILALIRQILTVAGTALVAKGYVQASDIALGLCPGLGHRTGHRRAADHRVSDLVGCRQTRAIV